MILLTYKKQTKHFHCSYEAVQLISSHKMHVFGQIDNSTLMYKKTRYECKTHASVIIIIILLDLKSHNTCNKGNKYMEKCRTILYINIFNLFHEAITGEAVVSGLA